MYDVMLGSQSIGTAQLEKQGLTYCIRCRCRLSGEVAYKVVAESGGGKTDLGLLVPENGAFVLTARVPVKRLGNGQITFRAVPRHVQPGRMFVPVSAEEPFHYLSRLENAFMALRENQPGVEL